MLDRRMAATASCRLVGHQRKLLEATVFFDRRAGLQASLPLAVALGRVCCRDQPTYVRWAAPWRIHAAMPSMDGTYDPHAAGGPQVEASCADACAAARAVAASGLMFRTCDHDRACPGSLAEPLTIAQCPRTSSASAAAHAHGTGWDRLIPANGARAQRVLGEAEHAVETGSTASLSDTWKGFCPRDGCARTRSSSLAWRAISCSIVSIIARLSGVREATDFRVAEGLWRVARQAYGIRNSSRNKMWREISLRRGERGVPRCLFTGMCQHFWDSFGARAGRPWVPKSCQTFCLWWRPPCKGAGRRRALPERAIDHVGRPEAAAVAAAAALA